MRISLKSHALSMVTLTSSKPAYELIRGLFWGNSELDPTKERFLVLGFNKAGKLLYLEIDNLQSMAAEPAEFFRMAIRRKAHCIMLARNTTANSLNPSEKDRELADRLVQASDLLGIPVRDYLIIAELGYFSFADSGLVDELRASSRCKLAFMHEQELNKRLAELQRAVSGCKEREREFVECGRQVGIAQGRKQAALEVAGRMVLCEDLALDFVREITGVSKRQLNRLKFPKTISL